MLHECTLQIRHLHSFPTRRSSDLVLSDILNEMIIVKEEEISPFPNGYCYLSFGSAKAYVIETGVASAAKGGGLVSGDSYRSEEHTSELQSRGHLVCRLLLEKKKTK